MAEVETWREHAGVRVDESGGFSLIACERCAFRHIVPIPSDRELREVYREAYYTEDKPLYLREHEEDLEWWRMCFRERFALFEEHLDPTRRRVLEVGSGPGTFLEVGQARGWQAVGVEPSRRAAAYARERGLDVLEHFFDDALLDRLARFDVVHLSDVLEHVPDPEAVIRRARRVLDPGGLLAVVVPNDYNAVQRALREQQGYAAWWVAPPHHINYFDFASLGGLLERCGLEIVDRTCTFPIDWFLLMGDDYVHEPALGRACHARRKRFELGLDAAGLGELKARLYRAIAACGLGREVALLARVP